MKLTPPLLLPPSLDLSILLSPYFRESPNIWPISERSENNRKIFL